MQGAPRAQAATLALPTLQQLHPLRHPGREGNKGGEQLLLFLKTFYGPVLLPSYSGCGAVAPLRS